MEGPSSWEFSVTSVSTMNTFSAKNGGEHLSIYGHAFLGISFYEFQLCCVPSQGSIPRGVNEGVCKSSAQESNMLVIAIMIPLAHHLYQWIVSCYRWKGFALSVHTVVKVHISMIMIPLNYEPISPLWRPLSHLVRGIIANQSSVDWSFNSLQE